MTKKENSLLSFRNIWSNNEANKNHATLLTLTNNYKKKMFFAK